VAWGKAAVEGGCNVEAVRIVYSVCGSVSTSDDCRRNEHGEMKSYGDMNTIAFSITDQLTNWGIKSEHRAEL
jgi:hypothetical protein